MNKKSNSTLFKEAEKLKQELKQCLYNDSRNIPICGFYNSVEPRKQNTSRPKKLKTV